MAGSPRPPGHFVRRPNDLRLRLARLIGHHEFVGDRVPHRIEEARASVNMPPALINDALWVRANEEELLELLIGFVGDVSRARNVCFACIAEFEFRTLFLAIRTADEKHDFPLQN